MNTIVIISIVIIGGLIAYRWIKKTVKYVKDKSTLPS